MMIASTDRLLVRDWTETPEDLARVYDIYSRDEVMRWLGGGKGRMTDPAEARERVRGWRDRYAPYAGRWGIWAIEPREAGRAAGRGPRHTRPGPAGGGPTPRNGVGGARHPP
ncbi:GNAT family N-acetyltransferase, partial [Micromonospora sp. NPDC003776]